MRVAIIGSRTPQTEEEKEKTYALICHNVPASATELVSGGADGVDRLVQRFADEKGIPLAVFKPDYLKYGKLAPLKRNDKIIAYAQYVIALWDGFSHGTAYTVTACVRDGVPVKVIPLETRNGPSFFQI